MTAATKVSHRRRAFAPLAALLLAGCAAAPSTAPTGVPTAAAPSSGPTLTPTAAPPSIPISVASGAPTATPAPPSFAWQHLADLPPGAAVSSIAASPAGYAIIGFPRTAWFSVDGHSWTKSVLPFTESTSNGIGLRAHVNAIAGGPGGFVVVGGYDHKPCAGAQGDGGPPPCLVGPISWFSADGVTWRSSQPTPIPADGSALPKYNEIVRVWPAGDGFDAAAEARDSVMYHGNTLLHTVDGRTWTRLKPAPLPDGAASSEAINAHGGVASPDGRRVEWQFQDGGPGQTTLSTSSDGSVWNGAGTFAGSGVSVEIGPDAGVAGPWLLLGGYSGDMTWWRSDDLSSWQSGAATFTGIADVAIGALARWGSGYIAVGWRHLGEAYPDVPDVPVTLLSADGAGWALVGDTQSAPQNGPVVMVNGPAGLIGIGGDDAGLVAWLGGNTAP